MRIVWAFLWPLILYDGMTCVMVMALPKYGGLALQALSALFTSGVLGFLYKKRHGSFCWQAMNSAWLFSLLILAGISGSLLLNGVMDLSGLKQWFPGYQQATEVLYTPPLWVQILSIGVVIPAVEELIFRGFGFVALREQYCFWVAAVISSLVFGVYHGSVVQGIYAFAIALLLAWSFEQCRTILAPWIVHGAANLASVLAQHVLTTFLEGENAAVSLSCMTAAGGCGLALTIYLISRQRQHTTGISCAERFRPGE